LQRLRLRPGDMLIVEGNGSKTEIGRSAIWGGEIENCVHQNHIIRVRFLAGDSRYLNSYWNSPLGNGRVMELAASTSGLYTLSVAKVSSVPIPLPPLDEQNAIVTEIEEKLSQIDAADKAIGLGLLRAARVRQPTFPRWILVGRCCTLPMTNVQPLDSSIKVFPAPASTPSRLGSSNLLPTRSAAQIFLSAA
jgi:type I restriction enzyme, S subunit